MDWDRKKERKAGKNMTIGSTVFALIFAIFWCFMAASMGAGFMVIFGILFIGMTGYRLYVLLQLAKDQEEKEHLKEADPWERPAVEAPRQDGGAKNGFCPYCGSAVQAEFQYCPNCGRKQA